MIQQCYGGEGECGGKERGGEGGVEGEGGSQEPTGLDKAHKDKSKQDTSEFGGGKSRVF